MTSIPASPVMYAYFGTCAVLVGLLIGSFLNVCIARLPEGRSVAFPRSHCPRCGTTLGARDLVPVLSWLALGGRCRTCAAPISPMYPLIEILGGLLAWLVYRRVVPDPTALDGPHLAAWVAFYGFVCLLVVASYVDLRHWIIPDETSIYAAPFGVAAMVGLAWLGYDGALLVGWRESVLGAMMGAGFLAMASLAARIVTRTEGLGLGDVKLLLLIGAFTGVGAWVVLVMASFLGVLVGLAHLAWTRRRGHFPFGPSLAATSIVYVLYGDVIIDRWLPGVALWMELLRG